MVRPRAPGSRGHILCFMGSPLIQENLARMEGAKPHPHFYHAAFVTRVITPLLGAS